MLLDISITRSLLAVYYTYIEDAGEREGCAVCNEIPRYINLKDNFAPLDIQATIIPPSPRDYAVFDLPTERDPTLVSYVIAELAAYTPPGPRAR